MRDDDPYAKIGVRSFIKLNANPCIEKINKTINQ